jgi:hypothetical protein
LLGQAKFSPTSLTRFEKNQDLLKFGAKFIAKVNDIGTQFVTGITGKGKGPKEKINPMTKPRETVPLRAISEDL